MKGIRIGPTGVEPTTGARNKKNTTLVLKNPRSSILR